MKIIQFFYYIVFLIYISFSQIYATDLKDSLKNQVKLNDKIVFATGNADIGGEQLFVMDSDGSNKKRLTTEKCEIRDWHLVWFPGGRRIVFSCMKKGTNWQIYSVDPDGKSLNRLTKNNSEDYCPLLSPDGKKVAFLRVFGGEYHDLCVMNLNGSNQTQLTHEMHIFGDLGWSPDSRKIVFAGKANTYNEYQIYTINSDGLELKKITESRDGSFFPAWAQDGKKILYLEKFFSIRRIYTMNTDGSDRKRLTGIFEDTFAPEWSPDGRMILYKNMGKNGIYLMGSDGKNKRKLISGPGSFWPRYGWSHDGSKIIFERYFNNKSGIFLINLDGSDLTTLIEDKAKFIECRWEVDKNDYYILR